MDEKLVPVVVDIKARYEVEVNEFRNEVTLTVTADRLTGVLTALRDDHGFDQLVDVTAVDYYPQVEPRFHVVYQVRSLSQRLILCLRVPLNGNAPQMATAEKIFPGAGWYEREVFDMFGITFEGHSDLRRIIMPADWQGHPLRKDYPLGYEEVQFSFNYDDISLRKPHPKD